MNHAGQVGDISHGTEQDEGQGITHAHAPLARLCKLHIELDRNESAREVHLPGPSCMFGRAVQWFRFETFVLRL